jgi:hypothetical protein
MRVFVYFNLHKLLWSVRALEGPDKGRVIQHAHEVHLVDCTFKVSEAGRQRVLSERRKNVHSGVVGRLTDAAPANTPAGLRVTYNPYKYATFVRPDTFEAVHAAARVHLRERAAFILPAPAPSPT